jgi:hypothetical protein
MGKEKGNEAEGLQGRAVRDAVRNISLSSVAMGYVASGRVYPPPLWVCFLSDKWGHWNKAFPGVGLQITLQFRT